MDFKKKESNKMLSTTSLSVLILLIVPTVLSSHIDCKGRSFHCFNTTHFMICADLGIGMTITIGDFIVPCPVGTECHDVNYHECEILRPVFVTPQLEPEVSVISTTVLPETTTKSRLNENLTLALGESLITTIALNKKTSVPSLAHTIKGINKISGLDKSENDEITMNTIATVTPPYKLITTEPVSNGKNNLEITERIETNIINNTSSKSTSNKYMTLAIEINGITQNDSNVSINAIKPMIELNITEVTLNKNVETKSTPMPSEENHKYNSPVWLEISTESISEPTSKFNAPLSIEDINLISENLVDKIVISNSSKIQLEPNDITNNILSFTPMTETINEITASENFTTYQNTYDNNTHQLTTGVVEVSNSTSDINVSDNHTVFIETPYATTSKSFMFNDTKTTIIQRFNYTAGVQDESIAKIGMTNNPFSSTQLLETSLEFTLAQNTTIYNDAIFQQSTIQNYSKMDNGNDVSDNQIIFINTTDPPKLNRDPKTTNIQQEIRANVENNNTTQNRLTNTISTFNNVLTTSTEIPVSQMLTTYNDQTSLLSTFQHDNKISNEISTGVATASTLFSEIYVSDNEFDRTDHTPTSNPVTRHDPKTTKLQLETHTIVQNNDVTQMLLPNNALNLLLQTTTDITPLITYHDEAFLQPSYKNYNTNYNELTTDMSAVTTLSSYTHLSDSQGIFVETTPSPASKQFTEPFYLKTTNIQPATHTNMQDHSMTQKGFNNNKFTYSPVLETSTEITLSQGSNHSIQQSQNLNLNLNNTINESTLDRDSYNQNLLVTYPLTSQHVTNNYTTSTNVLQKIDTSLQENRVVQNKENATDISLSNISTAHYGQIFRQTEKDSDYVNVNKLSTESTSLNNTYINDNQIMHKNTNSPLIIEHFTNDDNNRTIMQQETTTIVQNGFPVSEISENIFDKISNIQNNIISTHHPVPSTNHLTESTASETLVVDKYINGNQTIIAETTHPRTSNEFIQNYPKTTEMQPHIQTDLKENKVVHKIATKDSDNNLNLNNYATRNTEIVKDTLIKASNKNTHQSTILSKLPNATKKGAIFSQNEINLYNNTDITTAIKYSFNTNTEKSDTTTLGSYISDNTTDIQSTMTLNKETKKSLQSMNKDEINYTTPKSFYITKPMNYNSISTKETDQKEKTATAGMKYVNASVTNIYTESTTLSSDKNKIPVNSTHKQITSNVHGQTKKSTASTQTRGKDVTSYKHANEISSIVKKTNITNQKLINTTMLHDNENLSMKVTPHIPFTQHSITFNSIINTFINKISPTLETSTIPFQITHSFVNSDVKNLLRNYTSSSTDATYTDITNYNHDENNSTRKSSYQHTGQIESSQVLFKNSTSNTNAINMPYTISGNNIEETTVASKKESTKINRNEVKLTNTLTTISLPKTTLSMQHLTKKYYTNNFNTNTGKSDPTTLGSYISDNTTDIKSTMTLTNETIKSLQSMNIDEINYTTPKSFYITKPMNYNSISKNETNQNEKTTTTHDSDKNKISEHSIHKQITSNVHDQTKKSTTNAQTKIVDLYESITSLPTALNLKYSTLTLDANKIEVSVPVNNTTKSNVDNAEDTSPSIAIALDMPTPNYPKVTSNQTYNLNSTYSMADSSVAHINNNLALVNKTDVTDVIYNFKNNDFNISSKKYNLEVTATNTYDDKKIHKNTDLISEYFVSEPTITIFTQYEIKNHSNEKNIPKSETNLSKSIITNSTVNSMTTKTTKEGKKATSYTHIINVQKTTIIPFISQINTGNKKESKEKATTNSFEFQCSSKNRGKISDNNDCRKFFICSRSKVPVVRFCPNNTVFSEITKSCTKNLSHCIRNNIFYCTREGRFRDILRDNIYYVCVKNLQKHYIRFTLQCQNGYQLDKNTIKCALRFKKSKSESLSHRDVDSEEKSEDKSEQKSSKSRNKSSNQKKDFECLREGTFPDPGNCKIYYICKGKKSILSKKRKKCSGLKVFHKEQKECVELESYECDD